MFRTVVSFVSLCGLLWQRDRWLEGRTRAGRAGLLLGALLAVVIAGILFQPGQVFDVTSSSGGAVVNVLPGLLWASFLVAGGWTLWRGIDGERENSALHDLLLAPIDPGAFFLARVLVSTARLMPGSLLLAAVLIFLYGGGWPRGPLALAGALGLGLLGLTATGLLILYLTAAVHGRELLFPLLWISLTLPVLVAVVVLTRTALGSEAVFLAGPWWRLLLVYDGVMLGAGWLLFGYAVEEV